MLQLYFIGLRRENIAYRSIDKVHTETQINTVYKSSLPDSDKLEFVEPYPLSEPFLCLRFPRDSVEVGERDEDDLSLVGLVGKTSEFPDCSFALYDISCLKLEDFCYLHIVILWFMYCLSKYL
jgi:hypothetical protein